MLFVRRKDVEASGKKSSYTFGKGYAFNDVKTEKTPDNNMQVTQELINKPQADPRSVQKKAQLQPRRLSRREVVGW